MNQKIRMLIYITGLVFVMIACGNSTKKSILSEQGVTVQYEGEYFEKSVFKTGGKMLYICGIKSDGTYFLGNMKMEENNFKELPIIIPEEMRVINMAIDAYGNCHMLWVSVEKCFMSEQKFDKINFEKSFIVMVNSEGKVKKNLDISKVMSEKKIRPFCFAVDDAGNYYFENNSEINEIIKLNSDGFLEDYILCDGNIEAIGCGKSGVVYCVYTNENGEESIGKLEENMFISCEVVLPEADASYCNINVGTDTELLLYNKDSGVYTYDLNTNIVEHRIRRGELPIYGQNVGGYGFCGDGRLCLMTQETGNTIFYYFPAGK